MRGKPPPPRQWTPAISGAELKAIRTRPPTLTRQRVAEAMGVHPNTIARWERDELIMTEPMTRFFRLICAQLKDPPSPP